MYFQRHSFLHVKTIVISLSFTVLAEDCKWGDPVKGKAIAGLNVDAFKNIHTRAACEQNPACKSVDWKPLEKACSLNKVTKAVVALGNFAKYEYIELECKGKSN